MWQASEGLIAILAAVFALAMFSKSSRKPSRFRSDRDRSEVAANIPNSTQAASTAMENAAFGTTSKDFPGEANHIRIGKNLD